MCPCNCHKEWALNCFYFESSILVATCKYQVLTEQPQVITDSLSPERYSTQGTVPRVQYPGYSTQGRDYIPRLHIYQSTQCIDLDASLILMT